MLTATALFALGVARVAAGPEGANVVGGAATITGQGGAAACQPDGGSDVWRLNAR